MKTVASVVLALLLGVAPGFGVQSVAELARKEKERRESLKNRPAAVVTNEDLAKVTKTPAIQSPVGAVIPETILEEETEELEGEEQGPVRVIIPRVAQPSAASDPEGSLSDRTAPPGDAAERLRRAEEMVELLTLKMNALWQKFYNMDDMTTQDLVQQEISDTYEKLVKAQEEAARLRERGGGRDDR